MTNGIPLHPDLTELEAGLATVLESPRDVGALLAIVQRPAVGERREVDAGILSVDEGLIGDNWRSRGSRMTADRKAHPEMQLNIMNARVAALVARERGRWSLAGDQLYVDLDLSSANLPPGTRLRVGGAVVEVTPIPHLGCRKFVDRFGRDAMMFVNSGVGRQWNLRGINARVVEGGEVKVDDMIVVSR